MRPPHKNEELRLRVDRFLREPKPTDLRAIFSNIRFRVGKDSCVRDVADFLSHQEDRNQGLVQRRVFDTFHHLALHMPEISPGWPENHEPLDHQLISNGLRATLRLLGSKIKSTTGLNASSSRKILDRALSKVTSFDPDGWRATAPLLPEEIHLLNSLSGLIISQPAYNQNMLAEMLGSELIKLHALPKERLNEFLSLGQKIAVFTAVSMHLVGIELGENRRGWLEISNLDSNETDNISVRACVSYGIVDDLFVISTPIFTTECTIDQFISAPLRTIGSSRSSIFLELDDYWKIRPV